MSVFIAAQDHDLLQRNRLDSFDALWALQLDAVDEPNTERGGWSSVYRLDLGDSAYYLKRQSNHLTRSLRHPLGEPTFAREFRNIERYRALGIPALQAAFFAQQAVGGERQAILLTRALDGWQDLDTWLASWHDLAEERRRAILRAVGRLARQLHAAGQMHGCFYPKHVFLREGADGVFEACLIDLEKTRPIWFGRRDQVKDLEPMLRRAPDWSEADVHEFISAYVDEPLDSAAVEQWYRLLDQRRRRKESRR
ncbi:lipopolysaccharide kinase InaA family protein [Pseudomonas aeruginosa]|nr:lipopolysaccharide kinase InaA family protein [Pseudomonas aeruginosa]